MRIWKMNFLLVAVLAGVILTGCKSDGDGDTGGTSLAQPVTILERVSGDSAALKELGSYHIETKAQYEALGDADIFPGEVDFDTNDLVIVSLGERSTGGFAVNIESIQLSGGELAITGEATTPAEDAAVTQALTYPYSAVLIPNTSAEVVVPYID
ncbi:MAG: protease complex subunit PrcB family protein [Planctomycetota bacterium]